MTRHYAGFRTFAFSAVLAAIPFNLAYAQDVTTIADRLKALVVKQGLDIGWSNISGDASSMVLEGVTLKALGEKDALPIGKVTLTGVTDRDGGFRVDTLSTSPFSMNEQGLAVEISPIVFQGLTLPTENAADAMSSLMMYESAAVDALSVKMAGKTVFEMQKAYGQMEPLNGSNPMAFSGGVEKFSTDLSAIEDPSVKGYIQALGYSQLDGDIKMTGSWQPTDGRWDMSQYDITINDVGTLGMTLDMTGLTPEFLKAANEISTKMSDTPAGSDTSAQQAQLMGMLSDATFNGASLRFGDDSLTSRIINLVATMQGAQPTDVVNMAKGMVPFALMQAQMADLAGDITPAINAYLDNPNSIEIIATPPKPVSFAEISAVSMASPDNSAASAKALWSLLGIQVKANQ